MRVTSTKRKALKLYGNRRSRRYEPQFHCGASHRTVLAYYCHAIAACRNCLVPSLGYSSFKSSQVNIRGLAGSPTAVSQVSCLCGLGPHRDPGSTAPIDHFRSCFAVRSQPRRVVSNRRVRAGVGDETVPSSRESGMTGFLPGAPARALFVCESPPPTVMIVSSRGLHGRMT